MSVLIKGMKMPDSCAVCRFAGRGGYFMERVVCMFTGKNDAKNVDRLPNCPLVALPDKHGRLVDAGECAEYFWEHLDDNGMAGAMNAINDMPTIVEAEDSKC